FSSMRVPSRSRKTAGLIRLQIPVSSFQTPNTKHQTPIKLQTPNPKLQRNTKSQAPIRFHDGALPYGSILLRLRLGVWIFFGVWNLVFGVSPQGVLCFTARCLGLHLALLKRANNS